ncbi:MAG TPA: histidine phosphatase family protein [Alphaproteobacteria bacterium]|nr:histidine phosphatase family protein [Alphaproteobacteria bacterium]
MIRTTRWWWIRHAPVMNPDDHVYGQLDLPADTTDRRLYEALGDRLPRDAVWLTTPLRRTQQTANALMHAADADVVPVIVPELMEQHFGAWQGRPRDEVYAALGARHPFWLSPAETRPPDGESFVDLIGRVRDAVVRLSVDHAGRNIIAVAHGGTIRAALAVALDLAPERALSFMVDPVSLTRIDLLAPDEDALVWRISGINLPA